MIRFSGPFEAKNAIMSYAAKSGNGLSDENRLALIRLSADISPVTAVVDGAELLYARAADLDYEGRELAASLATYAAEWGWHLMHEKGRGLGIAQAMQRENGVEGVWPETDADPVPDARFIPMPVIELPQPEPEPEPDSEA